jgi:cytochrome d ubiquinol oxidase subunit II
MSEVPMVLILVGLAAYAVLGGADFGAGLWELFARGPEGDEVREHTHRAMAPVWEANHVWLIFVLVVCWTAYPTAFASIMSTLTIPLFLAAIGIIMRGAGYAFRSGDPTGRAQRALRWIFSLSSVLVPFTLGACAGAIASGRVPVGNSEGDAWSSWLNPTSVLVGCLAVASAAYTAAVYLAGDAKREGMDEMSEMFRKRALISGAIVGAIAVCGPLVLHEDAKPLYDGLSSGWGLAAGFVSGIAGVATLALVYRRRFDPARASAALAVGAIIAGWGLAQQPSFLPGLTVEEAAAGHATLVAVVASIALGLLILLPSLALLFRLVLSGRFDPGKELPYTEAPPPRTATPPITRAAAAATACIGAAVTFLSQGPLIYVGLAVMLAGAALSFVILAAPEESA